MYVRGSYSNPVVGSTSAEFRNLAGRVDNLFFSGEATLEKYYGFLQGGYATGLAKAKAILNCLNDEACSTYKPKLTGEDGCKTSKADCLLTGDNVLAFCSVLAAFMTSLLTYF